MGRVLPLYDTLLETLVKFAESTGQSTMDAESLLQQIQTKILIFIILDR